MVLVKMNETYGDGDGEDETYGDGDGDDDADADADDDDDADVADQTTCHGHLTF